jgi:hypothetical protein
MWDMAKELAHRSDLETRPYHNEEIDLLSIKKETTIKCVVESLAKESDVRLEDRLVLPGWNVVFLIVIAGGRSSMAVGEFPLLRSWLRICTS